MTKPKPTTRAEARKLKKELHPFLITDKDPGNVWGDKPLPSKADRAKAKAAVTKSKGKSKKVLTNPNPKSIVGLVNKLKRKDDKMANDKQKSTKLRGTLKAAVWALFALHQGFAAWLIISNFDNYLAVATSIAGFGLALLSVGYVGAIIGKTYTK